MLYDNGRTECAHCYLVFIATSDVARKPEWSKTLEFESFYQPISPITQRQVVTHSLV
jgi:hypothetical protein